MTVRADLTIRVGSLGIGDGHGGHRPGLISTSGGWELTADLDSVSRGVPATIRALIEKQLERLSRDELRVLEGASVVGVEFAVAGAAAAAELTIAASEEACEALARRHHFLHFKTTTRWPDGTVSARYRFGHELYHRVISESLSESRSRMLHLRCGECLELAFRDRPSEAAPELFHHFEQASDAVRAVRYGELAANRAARNHAHRDAIDYLRRALAWVARLPDSDRIATEMRLQVDLGLQLQITQGFAAPAANRAYLRARDLCQRFGESKLLFPVLWGLWLYHKVRSELPKARAMAEELFALAQELRDPALVLQSHQALAVTTLCLGEPSATVEQMRSGTALYDPEVHHTHSFHFGQDPGVACKAFGAVALWLLGYPDQAIRVSREATQRSHELVQPSSQSLALHFAAMVHQCRREAPAARACAELALTIAADQGFSFWQAGGTVLRGWAIAESGDTSNGISILRQGLDSWQATGSVTYRTYFLALLAELLGREGRAEDGLLLLDEAAALIDRTSERLFEAEVHRLRGELLHARFGPSAEVVSCLNQALRVAQQQQSKSLELRAATSLLKLDGDSVENQEILSQVLDWFSEGDETRDLQEARILLQNGRLQPWPA